MGGFIELYKEAYNAINGKWCELAAMAGIYFVILFNAHFLSYIFSFSFVAFFNLGVACYSLKVAQNKEDHQEEIKDLLCSFFSFRNLCFTLTILFVEPITVTLGLVLLIIPGIYLYLYYSLAIFICADASNKNLNLFEIFSYCFRLLKGN